jgi:hypothetical protein
MASATPILRAKLVGTLIERRLWPEADSSGSSFFLIYERSRFRRLSASRSPPPPSVRTAETDARTCADLANIAAYVVTRIVLVPLSGQASEKYQVKLGFNTSQNNIRNDSKGSDEASMIYN